MSVIQQYNYDKHEWENVQPTENNIKKTGVSFITVIGIVLVILKLFKIIDLSWWIVLLPFYGIPLIYIIGISCFIYLWKKL